MREEGAAEVQAAKEFSEAELEYRAFAKTLRGLYVPQGTNQTSQEMRDWEDAVQKARGAGADPDKDEGVLKAERALEEAARKAERAS